MSVSAVWLWSALALAQVAGDPGSAVAPEEVVEPTPTPTVATPDPAPIADVPGDAAEPPASVQLVPAPDPAPVPVPVAPAPSRVAAPAPVPDPAPSPPEPEPEPAPDPEPDTVVPPVVVVPGPGAPELVDPDVLPWVATRGFLPGLLLLVATLAFAAIADGLGRVNRRLALRGILPDLTRTGSAVARLLAAVAGFGWIAAWVPANVAPALPWIIVGGAIAVGWSARDLLQDGLAWLVIALEGRVRPGQWIRGPTFRGEVLAVGPRALLLRDERGGDLVVPNRLVLQDQYTRDPVEWPTVEVGVTLPPDLPPDRAREALREATLLAPWVAPGDVQVSADPEVVGRWVVRVRLLEGTWFAAFEGSLRERVDDVLRVERRQPAILGVGGLGTEPSQ